MSTEPQQLTADDVALFLTQNPEFFQQHADVFANLRVPHPNETRAISLGERQIMTLRSRAKELEWRLAGLVHNAKGNEKINHTLTAWCARMLAETDATRLPQQIVDSLRQLFELPDVALRVWDTASLPDDTWTADITDSTRTYAASLSSPYCGPLKDHEAAGWLSAAPASLAIIPLSTAGQPPFGLLVLGSDDAERFTSDMGTAFLVTIGELSSAALSRLGFSPAAA
ncbi:DUF484 family protein [Paracandidimonas soli]|uniref:DUF484 family protein n=1 Tax=Paracandidimonas soli TaxID=1917182 RepID=A0A4R3VGQ5_9BURK|nr:DUF484 family protein [Paracandidimonas soli]TCV02928.1 hypothetical protein EV686_101387 [Paracandidimonas soli]